MRAETWRTVYNVAFALTEFKSPEIIETVELTEEIAHNLTYKLPAEQPVILTTALAGTSEWGDQEWDRILDLGRRRAPFFVVHLTCDLEENKRRVSSEERIAKPKPNDPEVGVRSQTGTAPLLGKDQKRFLELDSTDMEPLEAAQAISV